MIKYVNKLFDIPQIKMIVVSFVLLTLVRTGGVLSTVIFQSILVKKSGIENLPYFYILAFISSLFLAIFYIKIQNQYDNKNLFVISTIISVIMLCLARLSLTTFFSNQFGTFFADLLLFLIIALSFSLHVIFITAISWGVVSSVFSPSRFKELMHVFCYAAIFGLALSGLSVNFIAYIFTSNELVTLWLLLDLVSSLIVFKVFIKSGTGLLSKNPMAQDHTEQGLLQKIRKLGILHNPLILGTVGISILIELITTFSLYEVSYIGNINYDNQDDLAGLLGNIQIIASIITLSYLVIFKSKIILSLGIFRYMLILPLIMLVGFSVIFLNPGIFESATTRVLAVFGLTAIFYPSRQFILPLFKGETKNITRAFCELSSPIGYMLSGLLLLLLGGNNNNILILSIVFSIISIIVTIKLKTIYNKIIGYNLDKREVFDQTLESIEDNNNKEVNDLMRMVLNDSDGLYSKHEQLEVLKAIVRLKNPQFLGTLFQFTQHRDDDFRYQAIKGLQAVYGSFTTNPYISDYVNHMMYKIMHTDPSEYVRSIAFIFVLNNTPKKNLTKFIREMLSEQNTVKTRISIIRALRELNIEFINLFTLKFLTDPSPRVVSECIISLLNEIDFEYTCYNEINNMLKKGKEDWIKEGLKALIHSDFDLEEKVKTFTENLSVDVRIHAFLYLLKRSHISLQKEDSQQYLESLCDLLINQSDYSDEQWEEFLNTLLHCRNELTMDSVIMELFNRSLETKKEISGMKLVAKLMHQQMSFSELNAYAFY